MYLAPPIALALHITAPAKYLQLHRFVYLALLRKQFKILINFGHFWSFGAPVEAPKDPWPLILEVYHNLL